MDYNRRFAREPKSLHNAHRPLAPHETLEDTLLTKVERKLSNELTLNYKRKLFLVKPNEFTTTLRGKRVVVMESEDGSVIIRYRDRELAARVFERDGNITQRDVEDNKYLSNILDQLRQKQLNASQSQLQSRNHSLREKCRVKASIEQRR